MNEKICKKCKASNEVTRYFCKNCGSFLNIDRFSNSKVYELQETKVMRIIDNLKHTPHSTIVWNDTIDIYSKKVERFKALFNLPEMEPENNSGICDKMNDFIDFCRKPDFQIAFVGTIKTGKSTLINALLGHNYASMDVTPETAALTKFRSSAKDYVRITFYDEKEWKELWNSRTSAADAFMKEYKELNAESQRKKWVGHNVVYREIPNDEIRNELQIWSSSKRAEHYFVKEVEVGISNLPKDFPQQVVFVDTPGLSDPVGYRSDITKQYIRKANAVFVCVDAKKMQKEEIETISSVFSFASHNKDKVHIIATHWDNFNYPLEDWMKQKEWMIKRLHGKGFYDDIEMAESNIMYSSAFIYNLCRDIDCLDYQRIFPLITFGIKCKVLSMEQFPSLDVIKYNVQKMMEVTNIDNIKRVVQGKLIANYKKLLVTDVERKYIDIKYTLSRIAEENKESVNKIIEVSAADYKKMEEALAKQKKNYDEVAKSKELLMSILSSVEKTTDGRLKKAKDMLSKLEARAFKGK